MLPGTSASTGHPAIFGADDAFAAWSRARSGKWRSRSADLVARHSRVAPTTLTGLKMDTQSANGLDSGAERFTTSENTTMGDWHCILGRKFLPTHEVDEAFAGLLAQDLVDGISRKT